MRLLQLGPDDELTLTRNLRKDLPPYAILSHTWGDEDDEVTFEDIIQKTGKDKPGYEKIVFCGRQARKDSLRHFWVDTCCIDRRSSAELAESIHSMFKWYQNSTCCYVYLTDVLRNESGSGDESQWQSKFRDSRWFRRGWTLQELLAPKTVRFFDQQGAMLGDKRILRQQICNATGIAETALEGLPLTDFLPSERLIWARNRETTLDEDWAYSLQGIFDVYLSPKYGEGREKATRRLRQKVRKAFLADGADSATTSSIGNAQILDPVFLDVAFLETQVTFVEGAKARTESYNSKTRRNSMRLPAGNVLISDLLSTFFTLLGHLFRFVFLGTLPTLEGQLDVNNGIPSTAISLEKETALMIEQDEEQGQETLNELEILQKHLKQTQMKLPQGDKQYDRTRKRIRKLSEECRQTRDDLDRAVKQLRAQWKTSA